MPTMHLCRKCKEIKEIAPSRATRSDWLCSPCANAARREYSQRAEVKQRGRPYRADWERRNYECRKRDPAQFLKLKVRSATRSYIARGRLVRQPCEVCGAPEVHAHHDDYSKPLDVRWLCPTHHHEHHAKAA